MTRTAYLKLLLTSALLLLEAIACAANDIKLEDGSTLTVTEIEYSRILPHAFYDQAVASLPHLFPGYVLLAGRRSGVLGEVIYSLVCYKETQSSERAVVEAVGVYRGRAWRLDTTAPASYGDTLMQVLEQIGKLAAERGP